MSKIFQTAPLRYVVPVFFISMFAPYFIENFLYQDRIIINDASIESLLTMMAGYIFPILVLWFIWCRAYASSKVFGGLPTKQDCIKLVSLGLTLVALSFLTLYLVFYPLSLIYPEFVESWILDMPEILRPMDTPADLRFNVVSVLVVVLLAPILEEFVFRGFLLGRLNKKFGFTYAVIITSILFAILHGEILGAFVFSVFMCLVRFKYKSLIAPMIVHMSNNFFVILIIYFDQFVFANVYEYTIEEFQSYWYWAIIGFVFGVPCLYRFYKQNLLNIHTDY